MDVLLGRTLQAWRLGTTRMQLDDSLALNRSPALTLTLSFKQVSHLNLNPGHGPKGCTKLHQNLKQPDQITVESTAGELNSGYGVYKAEPITRSIPDETVVPSDGPITICAARSSFASSGPTISGVTWNRQRIQEREGVRVAITHCNLLVAICESQRSSRRNGTLVVLA